MRSPSARTPSVVTSVDAPESSARAPVTSAISDASGDGILGHEQPAPGADDVLGRERAAVAEHEVVAQGEHDASSVVLDAPRLRERRPDDERADRPRSASRTAGSRSPALPMSPCLAGSIEAGAPARIVTVSGIRGDGRPVRAPVRRRPEADEHGRDDEHGDRRDDQPPPRRGRLDQRLVRVGIRLEHLAHQGRRVRGRPRAAGGDPFSSFATRQPPGDRGRDGPDPGGARPGWGCAAGRSTRSPRRRTRRETPRCRPSDARPEYRRGPDRGPWRPRRDGATPDRK